jgi:ABC-type antimicrobial peptide transport system ATPase subunit
MTLYELFEQYGISQKYVADKIGMGKGTFNNKIIPTHNSEFTPAEMVKILEVLEEMQKGIRRYITTI